MADRPLFITTPNGNIVAMGSGGNPVLDEIALTVTWNGVVEQFNDLVHAQIYYAQVQAQMTAITAPSTFMQDLSGSPIIYTISPNPFSVTNDGTFVQVIGTGFKSTMTGFRLFFDDVDGGLDLNGYRMDLRYINANLMTGVWASDGDAVLADGIAYIFIANTTPAVASNILTGRASNLTIEV